MLFSFGARGPRALSVAAGYVTAVSIVTPPRRPVSPVAIVPSGASEFRQRIR
jgi:hypothetical protein